MAKRVLPKGYKKKAEPAAEANPSDVEEISDKGDEPAAAPTVFEQKTVAMEVAPEVLVAAIPTGEVEVVSNAPDLRALDADISAFECLDFEVRGGTGGSARFARHLADIERAMTEASVSAADAEVLKDKLVLSRQLAFVSVELSLPGLIYNANAVESVPTRSNAWLEELKARALGIMQTGVDCGQHLQPEVRRHLAQLVQKIDEELAKPERVRPAKQPCAGPEQWPEGKPSTTELEQAVDSLGVDPGAATVAAPAEEAPIPLVVQKDDGSEQWPTGAHEAAPTGAFVSNSRATEEMTTKAIRTPLPPPPTPEPGTALIDPFDVAPFDSTAAAGAVADLLLAQIPPAPPAGPAHPEPEPQADPALAHTEAAIPATPPKGVPATAPLGGMIGQTMVGNPTGSQPAVPPVEPPPPAPPPPDQNDGLDEVQKLVIAYIAAPVAERLKGEHRQNYRTLSSILNIEVNNEKQAVARRAREMKALLETAFQVAEFAQQVDGIDLTAIPMSVAGLATLPEPLLKGRIDRAKEFRRNRDANPLTPEVTKCVIAFLKQYEEALERKLNPHPTPDPAKPHGPGSRPAMPVPPPKAAAAAPPPKSEAPTGLAPAVPPPAPAAPLPTPVINTPPPSQESVMLSPSIAPPAPTASPFSALVGGAAVRPGMHVGTHESVEAKAAREAAERRQKEVQRLQRNAKVKQVAYWVIGALASLFVGGAIVLGVLFFYRRLNHQEALLNKLTSQSEEVSQAMRDAARERARSVVADASTTRQEQHASTRNGGLRCSPAGQRSECSSLPPDTHQSPTGPGYYCPQDAPMTPMGSGGYNACHCQWCQ